MFAPVILAGLNLASLLALTDLASRPSFAFLVIGLDIFGTVLGVVTTRRRPYFTMLDAIGTTRYAIPLTWT